ncbi:MAG: glycosyl transferase, partial [Paludibacteraceae bacterium]|nr:glycosyl transferase [Paludibacteraceae bacterium]
MTKDKQPDYIFETSWEVCNRVGGIYAVLSTRAASMQAEHPDKVFFFGPDFGAHSDIYFKEDKKLLKSWLASFDFKQSGISSIRVGRWLVPGEPIAILLKFDALWPRKDEIYAWAWDKFQVQSHAAYGDYDESCLFGYAAGMV